MTRPEEPSSSRLATGVSSSCTIFLLRCQEHGADRGACDPSARICRTTACLSRPHRRSISLALHRGDDPASPALPTSESHPEAVCDPTLWIRDESDFRAGPCSAGILHQRRHVPRRTTFPSSSMLPPFHHPMSNRVPPSGGYFLRSGGHRGGVGTGRAMPMRSAPPHRSISSTSSSGSGGLR